MQQDDKSVQKGYNEKNPKEPEGAFPPASEKDGSEGEAKSLARDKHQKEKEEEKKPHK